MFGAKLLDAVCSARSWQLSAHAQTAVPKKPAPDVLIFNNGDQLTGKLQRATGGSVVFKSDMAGEVTVSLDKIKELRSDGGFAVLLKQEKALAQAAQPLPSATCRSPPVTSLYRPLPRPSIIANQRRRVHRRRDDVSARNRASSGPAFRLERRPECWCHARPLHHQRHDVHDRHHACALHPILCHTCPRATAPAST